MDLMQGDSFQEPDRILKEIRNDFSMKDRVRIDLKRVKRCLSINDKYFGITLTVRYASIKVGSTSQLKLSLMNASALSNFFKPIQSN